jgi:type I restriction enzyme R subunit
MLNFDYLSLKPELTTLYQYCNMAELKQYCEPNDSVLNARWAVEWLVQSVYALKREVPREKATLLDLMNSDTFRLFINDEDLMLGAHWIRKAGNLVAHGSKVSRRESFITLAHLYDLVGGVMQKLDLITDLPAFDESLIPKKDSQTMMSTEAPVFESCRTFARTVNPGKLKNASKQKVCHTRGGISEAETRRSYIDLMLREAGWEILSNKGEIRASMACIEVKVEDMPSSHRDGYADYVLFGSNGKPLAVIEAKKTVVKPFIGRQQAENYATCLERKYGVRPVIYYTNAVETYVIDGLGYPDRELYSFHSQEDLERIMQQRNRAQQITDFTVKDEIANRPYQKRAIKHICEHLNTLHRRGLLVMATGTGKTRTSIALVDVLQRAGWVKRTLFLADRTALVSQAQHNFSKLLPNVTTSVISDKTTEPDINARILFSTYQTMVKLVEAEAKAFSVGVFDLIIIDEAHRSVFGKYGQIFNYFDSFLIGLTATPREDVDKSTYDLLQLEEPNDCYDYREAVDEHYLVDYIPFQRGSKIVNEGITYNELSKKERDQLEQIWEYEGATENPDYPHGPHDLKGTDIFKYVYNKDTVDKVLQDLMEHGLKVNNGERIGKSIIFAMNTKHAQMIVKRFKELYPHLGPDFCTQIDYSINYSQTLIDNLTQRDNLPQIAVSVNMLDTGIDVPDILNLVFFKRVRSRIKFIQMIGRGTRLSADIFGPGKDKEYFYIFDWGGNFRYFSIERKERDVQRMVSLSERIFAIRTEIACILQKDKYQSDESMRGFHNGLKDMLRGKVLRLSDARISVRDKWDIVTKFRKEQAWQYISKLDEQQIKNKLAPLMESENEDDKSLLFDLLVLIVQKSLLNDNERKVKVENQIVTIARSLTEKASISAVREKLDELQEVQTDDFWGDKLSIESLEKIRLELRGLMQYLAGEATMTFEVNIMDQVSDEGIAPAIASTVSYRKKVLDYLTSHSDNPVLQKIKNAEQLSSADIDELERILWKELGTKEEYERYLKDENLTVGLSVAAFIRTMSGLDREKVLEQFTDYISANTLTADQEEFINNVLNYVCQNGDMEKAILGKLPIFSGKLLDCFSGKAPKVVEFVDYLHTSITAA